MPVTVVANPLASSGTEVAPRPSRSRMPRRIEWATAEKVTSSVRDEY